MSQEVLLEKPHAPSENSTRKRLTRGRFFEGLLNHMESENKKKIGLGRLNCTKDKMDRNGGNKTQIICRVVPIISCQNSSWIMGSRIYGEGRTKIPQSLPATIILWHKFQDRQGLYLYKNASNTKINSTNQENIRISRPKKRLRN